MKHIAIFLTVAACLAAPAVASAHERQVFEIGHDTYEFTIGSLNEPVSVDDKTGLDLMVRKIGAHDAAAADGDDDHHSTAGAVTGLESTLKVELSAGSAKRVMDISPVYGTPGAYKNTFYPTVATTLSYRIFGTIDGTPIDFTTACSPAGHARAEEDKSEVKVSEGVTRILKTGGFGCPAEKEDLGFPERSASVVAIGSKAAGSSSRGTAALAVAVAALILAGKAVMAGKKK